MSSPSLGSKAFFLAPILSFWGLHFLKMLPNASSDLRLFQRAKKIQQSFFSRKPVKKFIRVHLHSDPQIVACALPSFWSSAPSRGSVTHSGSFLPSQVLHYAH